MFLFFSILQIYFFSFKVWKSDVRMFESKVIIFHICRTISSRCWTLIFMPRSILAGFLWNQGMKIILLSNMWGWFGLLWLTKFLNAFFLHFLLWIIYSNKRNIIVLEFSEQVYILSEMEIHLLYKSLGLV